MTVNKKNKKRKAPSYTDRQDGYGPGGAESNNQNQTYEKERESKKFKQKSSTKDETGSPNQQGEMDQYTFRE